MDSKLDQAREWAEDVRRIEAEYGSARPDALAGASIIESLPDTVVDGDKLREVIADWGNRKVTSDAYTLYRQVLALLPTPSLPTLADMPPEDRRACQWMQADFQGPNGELRVVITKSHGATVDILLPSGAVSCVYADTLTPLPDLPRLEWPGSHADTITAKSAEDVQAGRVADFEPALPCPEDVPAGEPWIVRYKEREWVGVRKSGTGSFPWSLASMDGRTRDCAFDSVITLVSLLVTERKENA